MSDGRKQIRRYSPTKSITPHFEPQTEQAKKWLEQAGWPVWKGKDETIPPDIEPYYYETP